MWEISYELYRAFASARSEPNLQLPTKPLPVIIARPLRVNYHCLGNITYFPLTASILQDFGILSVHTYWLIFYLSMVCRHRYILFIFARIIKLHYYKMVFFKENDGLWCTTLCHIMQNITDCYISIIYSMRPHPQWALGWVSCSIWSSAMLCGFTITVIDSIMSKAFQSRMGVQFGDVDIISNLMFADNSAVFANVD